MGQLICENGPENKGLIQELIKRYHIKNVRIASYHSQAKGLVERGHQPVLNTLLKLKQGARVSTSTQWALGTSGRRARC